MRFKGLSASGHSCGLSTVDIVYCWGLNTYGALGDGTQSQDGGSVEPVRVLGQG